MQIALLVEVDLVHYPLVDILSISVTNGLFDSEVSFPIFFAVFMVPVMRVSKVPIVAV